jgi:hypothetical protein
VSQESDDYWKNQFLDHRRNQLETVKKAASWWSALFAAVLGVFGTVAFAGGFTAVDDLESGVAVPARSLAFAAILLVLAATVCASLAGNSLPRMRDNSDFNDFRDETKRKAEHGLHLLRASMVCGMIAAVIVVGSSAWIWFAPAQGPAVTKVVAVINGNAVCGKLELPSEGTLTVAGQQLRNVDSITVVTKCP